MDTTLTYMIPLLTDTIRRRLEGLTINEVRVTGPQQQGIQPRTNDTKAAILARHHVLSDVRLRRFVEEFPPATLPSGPFATVECCFPKAKKQG